MVASLVKNVAARNRRKKKISQQQKEPNKFYEKVPSESIYPLKTSQKSTL